MLLLISYLFWSVKSNHMIIPNDQLLLISARLQTEYLLLLSKALRDQFYIYGCSYFLIVVLQICTCEPGIVRVIFKLPPPPSFSVQNQRKGQPEALLVFS